MTSRRTSARSIASSVAVALAVIALQVSVVGAQRIDSTRAGVATPPRPGPVVDSSRFRPPLTPAKAFLHSLVIPGWGQSYLHRPKARALFVAVEIGAIFMNVKTRRSLNRAKAEAHDSIVGDIGFPYQPTIVHVQSGVLASRKQQVEDWSAILVFNHLFSGADAFVAANLWDFPAQLGGQPGDRRIRVTARIPW